MLGPGRGTLPLLGMKTRNLVPTPNRTPSTPPAEPPPFTLWRRPQCQIESGYPRSTFYARIKEGLWPRPVHIGPRAVAWPVREARAVLEARISGESDAAIRELVTRLEASRKRTVVAE